MSSYGTVAALAALLLAGCASSTPPETVSQGAVAAEVIAMEPPGVPEFNDARIGRDNLRSRIQN